MNHLKIKLNNYEEEISNWSKLTQEYQSQITNLKLEVETMQVKFNLKAAEQEQEYNKKTVILETKIKDLENALVKYQTLSKHEFSTKSIHKKNDTSADMQESHK